MSLDEPASSKSAPVEITEGLREHVSVLHGSNDLFLSLSDEAALYDRQIRLWGLEAQQRSVCHPSIQPIHASIPPSLWVRLRVKEKNDDAWVYVYMTG
jgi:hypothetical protein